MKKSFTLFLLFTLIAFCTQAQDTLLTHFPDGRIKEIRVIINSEIIKASQYHIVRVRSTDTIGTMEYSMQFTWDKPTKTIESYWAVDDTNKLEMLFFQSCPDYTIKQHYGSGPLNYVESYKNKVLNGNYENFYENGKLTEKGQYTNGKKTGIWTYYDWNGNEESTIIAYNYEISILYCIIPASAFILILLVLSFFISRKFGYNKFYLYYCLFTILLSIVFPFSKKFAGRMLIWPFFIAITGMVCLSLFNLFAGNKVTVKKSTSILFALTGILFGILFYTLFELTDMLSNASGAVLF